MHSFTEIERAKGRAAFDNNPGIGISPLAMAIGRSKDAAKQLREEFQHDLGTQTDLIRSRPGELDFGLDRLFPHPFNTRLVGTGDSDIIALATAIGRDGQLEPLTAVRSTDGLTEALVIDGVRRLTALRRLAWPTAKVVLVEWQPTEVAAFIQARDRLQKRLSPYEFALHIDAIVASYPSEAACAAALGMKPDMFSKSRAPAQLPDCVFEKIIDPRKITVKEAAAVRAMWKRDPHAITAAMTSLLGKAPAKEVLSKMIGNNPVKNVVIPRTQIEHVLDQLTDGDYPLPAVLKDLFHSILGRSE